MTGAVTTRYGINDSYNQPVHLLPIHQFNTITLLPELVAALAAKCETVERPPYNGKSVPSTDGADDELEAEGEAENGGRGTEDEGRRTKDGEPETTKGEEKSKSKKKNFEETSEEGE